MKYLRNKIRKTTLPKYISTNAINKNHLFSIHKKSKNGNGIGQILSNNRIGPTKIRNLLRPKSW